MLKKSKTFSKATILYLVNLLLLSVEQKYATKY